METQNKKAEVNFFDKFNKEGGYAAFDDNGYRKIISILKEKLNGSKVKKILDLGCGTGSFTFRLSQVFNQSEIIGVDISPGCVKRARKDYPKIKFEIGDIEKTFFKSSSIDLICYSGILHHFLDFSKVAKEGARILRTGGHFFSYDPNLYNPALWLYRNPKSPFSTRVGLTNNERLLAPKEVADVFERYGFTVSIKIISGINVVYLEGQNKILLSIYNFLDHILDMTPLASTIGAWTIGFGKKDN